MKPVKQIFILLIFACFFIPAIVLGVIGMGAVDTAIHNNGKPLPETEIVITKGDNVVKKEKTDKDGNTFISLMPGNYTATVNHEGKTIKKDLTVQPDKISYICSDIGTNYTFITDSLCPSVFPSDVITVGPKSRVGSGAGQVAEKLAKGFLGGLLGGVMGGGGSGKKPEDDVQTADDPVSKKEKTKFTDPSSNVSLMIGAKPTDKGILISTFIDDAPGKGTFQTVFLEDNMGRIMFPLFYEIYEIWMEWTLTVTWTRDTYVNGQHVKHEEGGWSESGRYLLDKFTRFTVGEPIWKRLGFNRATDGVRGLGTLFPINMQQLANGPVAVAVHITRPAEDPVITAPFIFLMGIGKDGKIAFQHVPRTPVEGFGNTRLVQAAKKSGLSGVELKNTKFDDILAKKGGPHIFRMGSRAFTDEITAKNLGGSGTPVSNTSCTGPGVESVYSGGIFKNGQIVHPKDLEKEIIGIAGP